MKIQQVQNTNQTQCSFKANFTNSDELNHALFYAKNEELKSFEKALQESPDKWSYSLTKEFEILEDEAFDVLKLNVCNDKGYAVKTIRKLPAYKKNAIFYENVLSKITSEIKADCSRIPEILERNNLLSKIFKHIK